MKFLLFLFLPFIAPAPAPPATAVNIYWTNDTGLDTGNTIYYDYAAPLAWPDFRGPQGPASAVAAVTTSGFGYKANMHSSGNKSEINVGVYCFFNKNKSWVRPGKTSSYILTHEQHHFDASFIAANLFIDRVKNSSFTFANSNDELSRIYADCCAVMNKMQNDYDGQTHNGLLEDVQEKWNRFFTEKLSLITK